MPTKTDTLIMELKARDQGLSRQLKAIQRDVDKLGRKAQTTGQKMATAGKKGQKMGQDMRKAAKWVGALATAMLALAARSAVRTFLAFQTEMNNVRAITNATEKDFRALTATAKELGATTQFTATQAAQAMTFLSRTGLTANQVIGAMPATLNLAAATAVDMATAADIATNTMKAMRLEVSDLEGIVDLLAKTTNSSNVDLMQLSEGLTPVAPIAAAAGESLTDLAAIIGILGDAGFHGSLAGVALRRSIINLTTGAGAAGPAIERLGLNVRDSEGNFVGLIDVFDQLGKRATSDADLVDLFGARALAAAQILLAKGAPAIQEFSKSLEDAGGTAERMRKQQMEGLVGSAKRLKSAWEATQIFFGEALEPAMAALADVLRVVVLPVIRGVVAGFQSIGVAARVIFEGVLTAVEILRDGVAIAFTGILEGVAELVKGLGWVATKLGLDIGEGLTRAGEKLDQFASNARRGALDDIKAQWGEMGVVWRGAGEQIEEIARNSAGVSDALDGTAESVNKLADAGDNLNTNLDETNAALERQKELLEDLGERYAEIVLTAAELELGAIKVIRQKLKQELGEIPADVQTMLDAVIAAARQALDREKAAKVARDFTDALKEELERIQFVGLGAKTDVDRLTLARMQQNAVQASIEQVRERMTLLDKESEEYKALLTLILKFNKALADSIRLEKGILDVIDGGGGDVLKDLQSSLLLIDQAARGAVQLAQAFGLVSDETAKVLNNLLQIGSGAATGAVGIATGDPAAIVSGALGMLGGIAGLFGGGGPTPTQMALEANTVAIFLLADEMGELAERFSNKADDLTKALGILRDPTRPQAGFGSLGGGVRVSPEEFREIYRLAQAAGLTLPEELLEAAARGFDVRIPGGIVEQLEQVLGDILDEIGKGTDEQELTAQSVTRSVSITELQANQLLAYQASQLMVLQDILTVLSGGTALVTAPALPGGGSSVTITVGPNEIYLTGTGADAQAESLVIEVLQLAGDKLGEQQQLLGVRP